MDRRLDKSAGLAHSTVWATWLVLACASAFGQSPATLGVPRGGRVLEADPGSSLGAYHQCGADRLGNAASRVAAKLGLPHKSCSPLKELASDAAAVSPDTGACPVASVTTFACYKGVLSGLASTNPRAAVEAGGVGSPWVIRGSVDENYLRGVATASQTATVRGDLGTAPWDWLSRTVHNSGMEQYCQWLNINTSFQSDHAFDEFISPVTNPFFFEDPRSLTELRPVFIFQNTPRHNPLFAGGNIEMFALQARLALNDRLSIVMPKLGFIAFQPDAPSPLGDEIGFAEIVVGPKLTFWRDDAANLIAAFGVQFEIAAGGGNVFQNTGSGSVVPYLTVGKEVLDNLHVLGAIGYRASFDSERSNSFFVSLHADYEFYRRIYPFLEINWFHYTSGGKALVANFEGGDLFNFGSTGASGEDIVTLGVGARYKIFGSERYQVGTAFEFPLTKGKDILDWRWTIDFIWRY